MSAVIKQKPDKAPSRPSLDKPLSATGTSSFLYTSLRQMQSTKMKPIHLPPVETTPVGILCFTPKACSVPNFVNAIQNVFEEWGIIVLWKEEEQMDGLPAIKEDAKSKVVDGSKDIVLNQTHEKKVMLALTTTQDQLETMAEVELYMKPTKASQTYLNQSVMSPFMKSMRHKFENCDTPDLFTYAERFMLLESILKASRLPSGDSNHPIWKALKDANIPIEKRDKLVDRKSSLDLYTILQNNHLIDSWFPMHNDDLVDQLTKDSINPFTPLPIRQIRNYFGDEVAFYYAWMDFLTKALIVPGILAFILFMWRSQMGHTVDNDPYVPFLGLGMFLWATITQRLWTRRENTLAYEWGTYSTGSYVTKFFNTRPEFVGEERISPVTGQLETFYPSSKRTMKFIATTVLSTFLVMCAFCVMIVSLNLQGYVDPNLDLGPDVEGTQHPFHVPFAASLSQPGEVLDKTHPIKSLIPPILHAIAIQTLNALYRGIALKLVDWENHETELSYQNSLIFKRFMFEAFDAYISLFYLAFYERNIEKLRGELVNLFNIDMLRRFALELLVPYASMRYSRYQRKKQFKKESKNTAGRTMKGPGFDGEQTLVAELAKSEYALFDDYIEMCIELGYLTLFASAYPRAATMAVVAHAVEVRSDITQICRIFRKLRPIRTNGIGEWNAIFSSIIWLSALTNCCLFAFSSQQMMQWLPSYFQLDTEGDQHLKTESAYVVVFIVFGLERILILFAVLIQRIVPDVPGELRDRMEHRNYILFQEAAAGRSTPNDTNDDTDSTFRRFSVLQRKVNRAMNTKKQH